MKNIYIFLTSIILLSSCGEEFLDLQPESVADIKDIYKTEEDFKQAMYGAYDELQSSGQYGRNFQFLFDTRATLVGESSAGFQDGIYYEVDRFLMRSENPLVQQSWSSLYKAINRSNLIIEKLGESTVRGSVKTSLNAEARFVRALCYFNIARLWGNAPLITKTISPDEALDVSRNEVTEIHNFLISELTEISQSLPANYDAAESGRATQYAAIALLGKVQIEVGAYADAAASFKRIIDSGLFTLQDEFADIFTIQNEQNAEIIFAVRYKRLVEETNLFFGRATQPITLDQNFIDAFDAADSRLTSSSIGVVGAYSVPEKFVDPAGTDGKTGLDFPVIRYADILLLYAEALNETSFQSNGEAVNAVNQVRLRAGLSVLNTANINSQEGFRNYLLEERQKELIFEGHAWFDLIRLGNPIEEIANALGTTITEGHFVYPIPQSEINRIGSSNFVQNPAYN